MNNHSEYSPNHRSNGAHPVASASTPGPRCAAYATILPILDEPAADRRLAREARAHLATCAYCQARQADYARLDAALRFAYGATATTALRMEDVMPNLDGAEWASKTPVALTTHTPPNIGDTDETDSAEVSATHTSARRIASHLAAPSPSGWRARRRLPPLATLAAAILIALLVAALFAAQSRFRPTGAPHNASFPPSNTSKSIQGVSMISPTDGWAIEYDSPAMSDGRVVDAFTSRYYLLHYLNGAWVKTASFDHHNNAGWICQQRATISMDSPTDGWATLPPEYLNGSGVVTDSMLHYSGGVWRAVVLPPSYVACQVTMISPTLGWAIGYTGDLNTIAEGAGRSDQLDILRYDGHTWRPDHVQYRQPSGSFIYLNSITALSASDAWVTATIQTTATSPVMEGSIILRYHPSGWAVMSVLPTVNLYSASFTSASEGWASGVRTSNLLGSGVFLRYHAGQWQIETYPSLPLMDYVNQVDMVSPTNGWAIAHIPVVGSPGAGDTLIHYDGSQWNVVPTPQFDDRAYVSFAWLAAASHDVWVVGSAQWPTQRGYPTPVFPAGQSATSYPPSPPFTALILRYHDGEWQVVES